MLDPSDRVMVFVDGSNLYYALKDSGQRTDLDYGKFGKWVCQTGKLIRLYYYTAELPGDPGFEEEKRKQQRFLESLRRTPFVEVRLGRMQHIGKEIVQKGVDVKIGVEMLRLAHTNAYDVAILVSADGDLADAVQGVKDMGKRVINAAVQSMRSYHLAQVSDDFFDLADPGLLTCLLPPKKPVAARQPPTAS